MEYTKFLDLIRQETQRKIGDKAKVSVNCNVKNNNTQKYSMTILYPGEKSSPAIYLEFFYEEFQGGTSLDEISDRILELYTKNKTAGIDDFRFYLNFEKVKPHIFCKIVNYKRNLPILDEIPYRKYLDLAVVFYCAVENESFGNGTILIHNTHLKNWNTDADEIYRIAIANTLHDNPCAFMEISELVKDMTGIELEPRPDGCVPLYVLTNQEKCFGAVSIYFPHVLEMVANRLSADFYVLPSSIHECMIIPVTGVNDRKAPDYQEMVEEVNEAIVSEEEILGESVYRYFREQKELRIIAHSRTES